MVHPRSFVVNVLTAAAGHQSAWEDAKVLHRDISDGNILVDIRSNEGFLTDWDLCKYEEDLGKPSHGYGRSVSTIRAECNLDKWSDRSCPGHLAVSFGAITAVPEEDIRVVRRPRVLRPCYLMDVLALVHPSTYTSSGFLGGRDSAEEGGSECTLAKYFLGAGGRPGRISRRSREILGYHEEHTTFPHGAPLPFGSHADTLSPPS